jgi:beta-glucanase (GH16 family)
MTLKLNNMFLFDLFLAFLLLSTIPGNPPAKQVPLQNNPSKPHVYVLAWSDEFNTDGKPNPANWTHENGFVRNQELQWYQAGNASCINGSLVIEGRRENVKNPSYEAGSPDWKRNRPWANYTSSSLQTAGLHQWTFGRFEIRARIDTAMGSWPAIWTLGVEKEWPSNGEIDIMEFYRFKGAPTLLANLAWGSGNPYVATWHTETRPLSMFTAKDPNWSKKFHVWRMDWDKDSVNLFLDGLRLNATPLAQTLNPDGSNPFLRPHYLLLNLAIGGNGGEPSSTTRTFRYEVDYVRVYQTKTP